MADVIQLLPDAIANQIAAGEVVQRPASVAKELLENAIDAGSTKVQLIIKDAGSTLIQVIDNGCGMSETDARLSFERHATSKLRSSEDLYKLSTMGFRGEALASIASIAQVEMRTRRKTDELGTRLIVEGSDLKLQEPCQYTHNGTSIAVKNIFFNTPARRSFLKSASVETKHIIDEFQRIAIAHPDVHMILANNGVEVYNLAANRLRQRIADILGRGTNKKLIKVKEETDVVKIEGYVGMPQFAKKSKADQYFFVNKRFIKSSYLNHAVASAYGKVLPDDMHPVYVIFLELDPSEIDVNVHPTKQEVKFEDAKLVYNYLKVAVKYALGLSIPNTLDFEQENSFPIRSVPELDRPASRPTIRDFSNASKGGRSDSSPSFSSPNEKSNLKHWQEIYSIIDGVSADTEEEEPPMEGEPTTLTLESGMNRGTTDTTEASSRPDTFDPKEPYQIHGTYIVSQIKSGFILIDQQAAHERILFEQFYDMLYEQKAASQHSLFPQAFELSPSDAILFDELLPEIQQLGFDIQPLSSGTFAINGVPAEMQARQQDERQVLYSLIEQYKQNLSLDLDVKENIATSLAKSASIKRGKILSQQEMQELIDQLFACREPFKSPSGKNCFITYDLEELAKRFKQ